MCELSVYIYIYVLCIEKKEKERFSFFFFLFPSSFSMKELPVFFILKNENEGICLYRLFFFENKKKCAKFEAQRNE